MATVLPRLAIAAADFKSPPANFGKKRPRKWGAGSACERGAVRVLCRGIPLPQQGVLMARTCCLCVLFFGFLPAQAAKNPAPPKTPKKPVTDVYHGVKVTDPYRWLEDAKDPAVRKWTAAQNRYTRAYFKRLDT